MLRSITALVLLVAPSLAAAAQEWRLVPAESSLALQLRQGERVIQARFERFEATIRFDPADPAAASVAVSVDLASFASGDRQIDGQATAAAWLGAGREPVATYRTIAFRDVGGGRFEVDAEIALKGVLRRVTHPVTITIDGERALAEGAVTLERVAFGVGSEVDPRGGTVGLEVDVRFAVHAVRA